jgi:hypothetical protein
MVTAAAEGDAGQVGDVGEGVLPMVMCSRELLGDVRCLVRELGSLRCTATRRDRKLSGTGPRRPSEMAGSPRLSCEPRRTSGAAGLVAGVVRVPMTDPLWKAAHAVGRDQFAVRFVSSNSGDTRLSRQRR